MNCGNFHGETTKLGWHQEQNTCVCVFSDWLIPLIRVQRWDQLACSFFVQTAGRSVKDLSLKPTINQVSKPVILLKYVQLYAIQSHTQRQTSSLFHRALSTC